MCGSLLPPRRDTEPRQRRRAANQEAGDKAEQGKSTEARQRMRAGIRERAKTGIQPQASARPWFSLEIFLFDLYRRRWTVAFELKAFHEKGSLCKFEGVTRY